MAEFEAMFLHLPAGATRETGMTEPYIAPQLFSKGARSSVPH
jgi:hypothetical protein